MIYVKSVAAGLAGAVLGTVLMVVLEMLAFILIAWWRSRSAGSGGFAFVGGPLPAIPVLIFAVAGFVAGFWWVYRKRVV